MSKKPHRLYIFTGKGGVGKTTLSRAFARELNNSGHKAVYLTFKNQSLGETHHATTDTVKDGLRMISLDLEDCARGYVEKRLNSKMIAGWIVKAPFFRALINMVPGFSYLIYLGKILELGKDDPNLIVILDAPASGHALTMVESTSNFQKIFESGIVFEDTGKMLARLNDPEYTKIEIISLPSLMSWQEAIELRASLRERTPVDVAITVNNAFYPLVENDFDALPAAIREKALNEKKLIEENASEMQCILPHSLSTSSGGVESELVGSLSKLI